jgi:glycosyltransferase involved in cell wall biosynthesis
VPRFSVVIPTFNRPDILPRAIESVLSQSYDDFEVIVVDDGSAQPMEQALSEIRDPRLRWVRRPNGGLSSARNSGIAEAHGEFVTFLDDDDEALPGWLTALAAACERSACGIVCCGALWINDPARKDRVLLPRNMGPLFENQRGLFRAGAYAVRREILQESGGYAVGAVRSQNTELALRIVPLCLSKGMTIECIDEPLVRYHRHQPHAGYNRGKIAGARYILEHHQERLRQHPRHWSSYHAIVGVNAARLGIFVEAREAFRVAIRTNPREYRNYARLLAASVAPIGRRVWRSAEASSVHVSVLPVTAGETEQTL